MRKVSVKAQGGAFQGARGRRGWVDTGACRNQVGDLDSDADGGGDGGVFEEAENESFL